MNRALMQPETCGHIAQSHRAGAFAQKIENREGPVQSLQLVSLTDWHVSHFATQCHFMRFRSGDGNDSFEMTSHLCSGGLENNGVTEPF